MEIFLEPMVPEPRLILFGAGHVAEALCPMAAAAGFQVTVVDEREEWATPERFPTAAEILCDDPEDALPRLPRGEGIYMIIVTHSHRLDEDLLRALSAEPMTYLGMIGSRAKVARFVARLTARGVPPEALERVYMPIGLDVGAVTPAEIAVSILAQLVQVRRRGESLPASPMSAPGGRAQAAEPRERGDDGDAHPPKPPLTSEG